MPVFDLKINLNLQESRVLLIRCLYFVAKFTSMTREPKLAVFCRPPIFDLKLNYDEEEEEDRKELIRPWPDLDFVFSDDPDYQGLLAEINTYVTMEIELVKQYASVRSWVTWHYIFLSKGYTAIKNINSEYSMIRPLIWTENRNVNINLVSAQLWILLSLNK